MEDNRPLRGIRVFELGLALAGPICARYLANFGAEVIKVESARNPDPSRSHGPGWISPEQYGPQVWGDLAVIPNAFCAGKLDVSLDLKSPAGKEAARRILAKCDVFVSNYSAQAIASLGFDYESVRAVKPDIIYLTLSGFGTRPDTPYYGYVVWGANLAALCGLDELTGPPEGPPLGIANYSFSDHTNALHGVIAVLAALRQRRQTGQGQAIDMSQHEAVVGLLGPQLLNQAIGGQSPIKDGNRLLWAAPQGVYRCKGDDRWVAISVLGEDEWRAFCRVTGHKEWASDPRFETVEKRLDHQDELDALSGEWTAQHTPLEVAEWLQRAGVAASPVADHAQMAFDSHLADRNFWTLADHARWGKDLFAGVPINLSETPGQADRAAPSIGQDNQYVLGEIAGYSDDEVRNLIEKGAVFPMAGPDLRFRRRYVDWYRHFLPQLPWPDPENG